MTAGSTPADQIRTPLACQRTGKLLGWANVTGELSHPATWPAIKIKVEEPVFPGLTYDPSNHKDVLPGYKEGPLTPPEEFSQDQARTLHHKTSEDPWEVPKVA